MGIPKDHNERDLYETPVARSMQDRKIRSNPSLYRMVTSLCTVAHLVEQLTVNQCLTTMWVRVPPVQFADVMSIG